MTERPGEVGQRFGFGTAPATDPGMAGLDVPKLRARVAAWLSEGRVCGAGRLVPAAESGMGVPVLRLAGRPEERARQEGELVRGVMGDAVEVMLAQMAAAGPTRAMIELGMATLLRLIPGAMRAEIRALAEGAGIAPRKALALTIAGDLHAAGCSTIVAQPPVAEEGSLIFGRNLDFISFGLSDVCACVTVHHPAAGSGEIPTAQIGWTGLWGTYTGWNSRGLCMGNMQAYNPRPDVPRGKAAMFSFREPSAWIYTELLRTCATVEQALARAPEFTPLAPANLMLADAGGEAALVEWDSRRWRARRPEGGLLYSTNHFNHPEMTEGPLECWRFELLRAWDGQRRATGAPPPDRALDAEGMRGMLHRVNQQELTLHSAVFEPRAGRMHLSAAAPPSSGGEWHEFPMDVWEQ